MVFAVFSSWTGPGRAFADIPVYLGRFVRSPSRRNFLIKVKQKVMRRRPTLSVRPSLGDEWEYSTGCRGMRQREKSLKILLFLPIIYFLGVFKSSLQPKKSLTQRDYSAGARHHRESTDRERIT